MNSRNEAARGESNAEDRAALGRIGTALVALEDGWPTDALDVLAEGRAHIVEARRGAPGVVVDLPPRLRARDASSTRR